MKQPELGLFIKKNREALGWSQAHLAREVEADFTTVSRWERGERVPYPHHRQKLMETFGWDASVFESVEQVLTEDISQAALRYWNVPYPRSVYFTGRQELLERLHALLHTNTSAILTHAVTGLGGIGKTQLAVEYAYRYYEDHELYSAVLWAQASSEEELFTSFATIARVLNLEEKQTQDRHMMIEAVKQWLVSHTGWLLVLDNVEDLQTINKYFPQRKIDSPGHVLLTTRCQAVGTIVAATLEVEPMSLVEGATFLLRRAKKLAIDHQLDQAEAKDQEMAQPRHHPVLCVKASSK